MVLTDGESIEHKQAAEFRPSRRGVLQAGAAGAAVLSLPKRAFGVAPPTGFAKELFLMDRITFGVNGDMHTAYTAHGGYTGFLEWQLNHEAIDPQHEQDLQDKLDLVEFKTPVWAENFAVNPFALRFVRGKSSWQVFQRFYSPTFGLDCSRLAIADLVLQSSRSKRQLYHIMNEFWMSVFNVYSQEKKLWIMWLDMVNTAIRPYALGRFGDMLKAVAKSPAMMVYLDQFSSKKGNPNENFARELLELYTVGVGKHTETDVAEVAKILTGWSIHSGETVFSNYPNGVPYDAVGDPVDTGVPPDPNAPLAQATLYPADLGRFVYDVNEHEFGTKTVLNTQYGAAQSGGDPNEGYSEGDQLIDDLAVHPDTADTLVRRLIQWLLFDATPAQALVDRVKNAFITSGGDIRVTLRELLDESGLSEIYQGPKAKIRRPLNKLIWTLRVTGASVETGTDTRPDWINMLVLAGHIPTGWPTPDGHPGESEAWVAALYPRLDMSAKIAFNEDTAVNLSDAELDALFGTASPAQFVPFLNAYFFLGRLPAAEVNQLKGYIQDLDTSMSYTTRDLQREAIAMVCSTPSAQYLF